MMSTTPSSMSLRRISISEWRASLAELAMTKPERPVSFNAA